MKLRLFILLAMGFFPALCFSSSYQVCFTPGEDCTDLIDKVIRDAKTSVYVQAYSFTSVPIASALIAAKKRGVTVNVILDRNQMKHHQFSFAVEMLNQSVPIWIDYKPAIAHNKVMIIDNSKVITGSFNFTNQAQYKNAENVIVISDAKLAEKYKENWLRRQYQSIPLQKYEFHSYSYSNNNSYYQHHSRNDSFGKWIAMHLRF